MTTTDRRDETPTFVVIVLTLLGLAIIAIVAYAATAAGVQAPSDCEHKPAQCQTVTR